MQGIHDKRMLNDVAVKIWLKIISWNMAQFQ